MASVRPRSRSITRFAPLDAAAILPGVPRAAAATEAHLVYAVEHHTEHHHHQEDGGGEMEQDQSRGILREDSENMQAPPDIPQPNSSLVEALHATVLSFPAMQSSTARHLAHENIPPSANACSAGVL
ncbi:hypothetical protein T484DRAFT_1828585 [Baffinella frigidus]|nr:hypothetical protein T484DRAFT_1828585 [Cryptophyta sp. CCMP2293]